jgi:TatD DNase family protein
VLVDTHCHLGDQQFDADRSEMLRRARASGVGHVIVVADSLSASERARDLARLYGLSATAGVHPHEATSWNQDVEDRLADLLADPVVVAIGETGLDYHYEHAPRAVQRDAFAAQLRLAARVRKPVVVHARDADADVSAMLADLGAAPPAVVLHSFSSGPAVLATATSIGAYLSFSGMVTFKNWRGEKGVAECAADRLLIETDAPYLSPSPHRGHRNEPAYVALVADRIAALRDDSPAAIAAQTTANAARCFGSRVAQPFDEP